MSVSMPLISKSIVQARSGENANDMVWRIFFAEGPWVFDQNGPVYDNEMMRKAFDILEITDANVDEGRFSGIAYSYDSSRKYEFYGFYNNRFKQIKFRLVGSNEVAFVLTPYAGTVGE